MNNKSLITAALLALGFLSQTQAANTIYLTGSSAFRGNCFTVLSTATNAGGMFDATPDIATRGNATSSKASQMLFHGNIGGVEYFVSCYWSGSEAGISSVAGNPIDNSPYGSLPGSPGNSAFLKTDGTVAYTQVATGATGAEKEAASLNGDLAMADTSKDVSLSSTFTIFDFGKVGIVPFTWVKCVQSSPLAPLTAMDNITHAQIRVLLGFQQPAAFFTGNAAHTNNMVYPIGRNKGSGTRVNELADSGYGITKPVQQFSINGIPFTGVGNANSLNVADNNGYESGGDVSKALRVDGTQNSTVDGNTGYITVGFLGIGDATASADVPNNLLAMTTSSWLKLNGVPESDGAIEEGQYSAWGNEHLYGPNGISGYKLAFGNIFKTKLGASLGGGTPSANSTGIKLGFMHAEKATDVAVPTRL